MEGLILIENNNSNNLNNLVIKIKPRNKIAETPNGLNYFYGLYLHEIT